MTWSEARTSPSTLTSTTAMCKHTHTHTFDHCTLRPCSQLYMCHRVHRRMHGAARAFLLLIICTVHTWIHEINMNMSAVSSRSPLLLRIHTHISKHIKTRFQTTNAQSRVPFLNKLDPVCRIFTANKEITKSCFHFLDLFDVLLPLPVYFSIAALQVFKEPFQHSVSPG